MLLVGFVCMLGGGYLRDQVSSSSGAAATSVKVEADARRIDELRADYGDHVRNAPTREEFLRLVDAQKQAVTRDELSALTKNLERRLDDLKDMLVRDPRRK